MNKGMITTIGAVLYRTRMRIERFSQEKRRWRQSPCTGDLRVFYGWETIRGVDEVSSGGMVKFQDLEQLYPNSPEHPNFLYLVSSALPLFSEYAVRAAKKRGVPFVLNQNGVAYPGWHGPGWEQTNRPLAFAHQQADYVFYQSEFCRRGAEKFLGCVRQGEVLYNPVDTSVFKPASTQVDISDSPRLLLAGSHHFFYRVQSAVDTLKKLHEDGIKASLEIAGRCCWQASEENSIRELQAYVRDAGLSNYVKLTGPYCQRDAVAMFGRNHILLHTKYNDPCPRLVVEAMACGVPVVFSATGGMPELAGEEGGVGVTGPEDYEQDHPPRAEDLAEAVKAVLQDHESYARKARERAVRLFDVKPWLERHQEVFSRMHRGEAPA
jgi:glycosyltransferase involved in cell wall biosynthesis